MWTSRALSGPAAAFIAPEAVRERHKNLSLALVFSAGVHLIVMLTLDVAPGDWRHGLQPSLRVSLKAPPPVEALAEPTPNAAPIPSAPRAERRTEPMGHGREAPAAQEGASLPAQARDRYYKSSEVDVPAVNVHQGPLVFPEDAYVWRLAGTVRARVFIDEHGIVESVHVEEARPRSGIFEQAAMEALRQVRYKPAEIGGVAVKSQKLVEVTFDPHEDMRPR